MNFYESEKLAADMSTAHLIKTLMERNKELEASLQKLKSDYDSVGAGGVSAQRVTQGKDHIAQDRKMVAAPVVLPDGWKIVPVEPTPPMVEAGATERITPHITAGHGAIAAFKAMLEHAPECPTLASTSAAAPAPAQEPFAYFKQDTYGWMDCSKDADGAIALYKAPQPQADARDAELVAAVVYASTEAMNSSMESPSFDGSIILESHHAASLSLALGELEQHRAAIAAAKGE